MPVYFRTDQAHIFVKVDGVTLDSTSWDAAEGGEITVETQSYNPGSMQPQITMGGKRTRGPITVRRVWSDTLIGTFKALDAAAGRANASVSYQVLASDGKTTVGDPITYTGIVGPVTRPPYDSMTSTPAQLILVVDLNEAMS